MDSHPGNPVRRTHPVATYALIAMQVAVWIVVRIYLLPAGTWSTFALTPDDPTARGFFLSPFIHLDAAHLGVNMAVLWLFGTNLERSVGSFRFLLLYLGAAWFASSMHWAAATAFRLYDDGGAPGTAVGASGAVAGLLGASVVRFAQPRLGLPWTGRRTFPVLPLIVLWLTYTVVRALALHSAVSEGVGHWAHLSGFLFGLAYAQLSGWHRLARAEYLEQAAAAAAAQRDLVAVARALAALLLMRPDDLRVRRELVVARLELGDRPGARRVAREGLVQEVKSGNVAHALRAFRAYGLLVPDLDLPPGVRYRIGSWLAEAGEPETAFRCLLESVREDGASSASAAALYRAGQLACERLASTTRAREAWERLLEQFPDSPWSDAARDGLRKLTTAS